MSAAKFTPTCTCAIEDLDDMGPELHQCALHSHAPALYEALRELHAYVCSGIGDPEDARDPTGIAEMDAARALLAQIEGDST